MSEHISPFMLLEILLGIPSPELCLILRKTFGLPRISYWPDPERKAEVDLPSDKSMLLSHHTDHASSTFLMREWKLLVVIKSSDGVLVMIPFGLGDLPCFERHSGFLLLQQGEKRPPNSK